MRLLLVEDNPRTLESLLGILDQEKFKISVEKDGLGGLNRARKTQFDLVLTDHKMPLMDGIALIRNLAELPEYREIPLILMTTEDAEHVRAKALPLGADYVFAKPLEADTLNPFLYGLRKRDII